jgi:myosin-1
VQSGATGGKPQVKKAAFESTKKKEVGVSDLTLISKISNEAINDNLKKRFENGEIYVCAPPPRTVPTDRLLTDVSCRRILAMCWFPSTRSETVSRFVYRTGFQYADSSALVGIYTDKVLDSYKGKNRLEVCLSATALSQS